MLVVALLIAVGTLGGMMWLQQGATERAVYFLAATWAIVHADSAGLWLIPLTEPYRTSRLIGETTGPFLKVAGNRARLARVSRARRDLCPGTARLRPRAIAMGSIPT